MSSLPSIDQLREEFYRRAKLADDAYLAFCDAYKAHAPSAAIAELASIAQRAHLHVHNLGHRLGSEERKAWRIVADGLGRTAQQYQEACR